MVNAVYRNAPHKHIRRVGNKLTFNGFWRNGNKRNVCVWPEQAAWSDLNKNENDRANKGGVTSFAKTILNMGLTEFMEQYGGSSQKPVLPKKTAKNFSTDYVNGIWSALLDRDQHRPNYALQWLEKTRRLREPNLLIGSGFANLSVEDVALFSPDHHRLIQRRIKLGRNIAVPLRGMEDGKVQNLFIRTIDNAPKEDKSRLLTGCGGSVDNNNAPRAFGFPHLIHDFPNLIICEGMADYFATECLLDADEKYLPIGAPGTAAITKWARWLSKTKYSGKIHLVYQLDSDSNGGLTNFGPGQRAAVEAKRALLTAGLSAHLFNWSWFLHLVSNWQKPPGDLADVFTCSNASPDALSESFLNTLRNYE